MATQIRPNRLEVSDRFPMLGFTVRTDGNAKRFEIVIGTSPELFGPDGKTQRNRHNFYSTRAAGPLPIERGEAVYVLPAEILARFVGQQKLYYGLATFTNGIASGEVTSMPKTGSPYINVAGLTGRSLQRVRLLPNRQRAASNYGKNGSDMEWAGDSAAPGTQPALPSGDGSAAAKAQPNPGSVHYDDGYGPLAPPPAAPPKPPQAQTRSLADDDSGEESMHGITGPIPDDTSVAQSLARAMDIAPEYPGASRFAPAAKGNYSPISGTRKINQIVIHITDGQPKLEGTVGWFQNPAAKVSSHYVVGQDGQVVQLVRNNDMAWHASQANRDSIGIEHVARSPHEWDKKLGHPDPGLMPTEAEYCASAALVNWLCSQFNIPVDRDHIRGHNEASPKDQHDDCPTGVWDWDYYMGLVTSNSCDTAGATASSLGVSRKYARARAMDSSFDINWNDVDIVGQPENYSCWATAAALVVGWRDRMSMDVQAIKRIFTDKTGVPSNAGLLFGDFKKLAESQGLVAEPPACYTVEGFRQMIESNGPLWIGIVTEDKWDHAIVVTGMFGDGSPENTYVRITDPWQRKPGTPGHPGEHIMPASGDSPGLGSRYALTYADFQKEYDTMAMNDATSLQIIHAGSTGGRTIEKGADQSYALAAASEALPNGQRDRGNKYKYTTKSKVIAAAAEDSGPQPVQLPQARLLTGWQKTVARGAIDALLAVASGPVGLVMPNLIDLVNKQGFSVGLGLGGDAGLLGGGGLSFGIILAPDENIGVFGSVSVSAGLLAGVSAGTRVIVVQGGIEAFNDTGYAMGITLEPEAGPSISAMALFNSKQEFDGVSFQLGVAASLSPIQIFTSSEKSVSAPITQSLADDEDSAHGIDGPIPDGAAAQSLARAMAISPEYPQASRFEPADSGNYRAVSGTRTINRCVIHITDGGANINGTIGWFKNPAAKVSAHYVIGQDGEVVQMVKHNDVAWHASSANGDSIGIEHVANTRGLNPTPAQYCASAALVNWLCEQFGISMDRVHVLGHSEADPKTTHKGCPNAVWDWDYYMGMVTSATCYEPQTQTQTEAQSLSVRLPAPPKKRSRSQAMDVMSPRLIGNSPVNTVAGGEGNVTWELDQFPGVRMTLDASPNPLQSAETVQLTNWPYCDHSNGTRSCAWFAVDWKFSGKALGEIRIRPVGAQQGAQPLRVEARIEDGNNTDSKSVSLKVRFTYHFSTSQGPEVTAVTELTLYADGSIEQKSNWMAGAAA